MRIGRHLPLLARFRARAASVVDLLGLLSFIAVAACAAPSEQTSAEPAAAVKLYFSENGMYQLAGADLEAAGLGWDDVDPTRLRLFHRGSQQPLWLQPDGESFTLRFYGQASESRYVRENVYLLRRGGGPARWMEMRGGATRSAGENLIDHYFATVRVEENRLYSPTAEEGDHWFWASLPAPQAQTFDVSLTALVSELEAHLRIAVWASTEAPASPDHHLRVAVNGHTVADETWDGRGRHVIDVDLPADVLEEGTNEVRVEASGDTGVDADVTFVDWIEVRYPRLLAAEDDRLEFEGASALQRLAGFTGPVNVFDVTDPESVMRVAGEQEHTGDEAVVSFHGVRGRRYLAVGPRGFQRPTRIAPARIKPDLRAAGIGVDYVAVGPTALLKPLQPLLEWRESQGLKIMAVSDEAIYDQFNHGLPEPEAIRAFLKHAEQAWQPAPQYLLLVGDATYDPRGYLAPENANRLPTFLIPTVYGGETASDVAFAQLDGDPWPDVAVGRMPARTPEQVRALVEKTLAYEQQASDGAWRQRILAVADGQDKSFRGDAQVFLDRFADDYQTELLAPEAGVTDLGEEVLHQLDGGNLLVAYFGHGSITQWGNDRILTADDVASLGNGARLPVMLNMTCLTGLFTHPKVDSLAETLLWQPDGGAVAVLAPTSLTLPADQRFLSQALTQALLHDRAATLGQAFLQAQRQVPGDEAGTRDVMQTFLLFGDPALHLALP